MIFCVLFALKNYGVSSFQISWTRAGAGAGAGARARAPNGIGAGPLKSTSSSTSSTTTTTTTKAIDSKDQSWDSGQVFQDWFENHPKTYCSPFLGYTEFCGGLRGLSWKGNQSNNSALLVEGNKDDTFEKTAVVIIPRDITLRADFTDSNWDVNLALQLCEELEKGPESPMSGYFALLPDQPAPNAIRHWTKDQCRRLDGTVNCTAGQKLVEAADRQMHRWRRVYEGLSSSSPSTTSTTIINTESLSWERFEWAMETVNSRSFCGLASTTGVLWRSVGAPLVACTIAWSYINSLNTEPSILVLAGLAMGAVLPTIIQILKPAPELVYMLPLLDLANHREEANSSIRWDPIRQHFSLFIGHDCLVVEDDGQTQVYFNYGSKSDAEWLLNFGFLPSISGDDVTSDDLRRRFAEEFVRRNS